MKYIFFLLAIATIVAEIPLEETQNLPLKETQNLSLCRYQAENICMNCHFPLRKSSYCKKMTVISFVCKSQDFPGTYEIVDKQCPPDSSCVDFISHKDLTPLASCIPNA